MAYLHCHKCHWSQDDFWRADGYTPFRQDIVDHLKEKLLSKEWLVVDVEWIRESDIPFGKVRCERTVGTNDGPVEASKKIPANCFIEGGRYLVEPQAYVAAELRRMARTIETMAVRTDEEWKAVQGKFKCPRCGSTKDFDID